MIYGLKLGRSGTTERQSDCKRCENEMQRSNEVAEFFYEIEFREAVAADAGLLIEIYNSAFYKDFIRYGECTAYGRSLEEMQRSILEFPKFVILCDGEPVGCISCRTLESGVYEIG